MLEAARNQLLSSLSDDALVLDIGGWADPVERADWVLDLMPYETRGLYEREGWIEPRSRDAERFTPETWIRRDICEREPYPFSDGEIDFVICAHTLEDVRDPVWVCSEMNRIAKAGYIEVPSRLEEQSWGVGGDYVGWSHHRWLIDVADGHIEFVLKLHSLPAHEDQHFPAGFWHTLDEAARVQGMWWEGGFSYRERIFLDEDESNRYLAEAVQREMAARGVSDRRALGGATSGLRARLGRLRR